MNKNERINQIAGYFEGKDDVSAVYLFGSLVKGRATHNSDVDIGVLFADGMPLFQRFNRKLEIANDLEDTLLAKVDIVDLDNADLYFVRQVMLNKEMILDRDTHRRVAFEVAKRREFFDRKRFYELYHSQALKRLEEKGREHQNG